MTAVRFRRFQPQGPFLNRCPRAHTFQSAPAVKAIRILGQRSRSVRRVLGAGGAGTWGVVMRGRVLGGRRRTSARAFGAAGVISLKNQDPSGTCGNRRYVDWGEMHPAPSLRGARAGEVPVACADDGRSG